jgi:magnesium-transporting ATPase (P-type)
LQNEPLSQPKDPKLIDTAPLSIEENGAADSSALQQQYNKLIVVKANLEDEIARKDAEMSVQTQKAKLLIPYSNKVFWFVVWYCLVSGWIVMLHGDQRSDFTLPESVLGLIAGSTMASVIGLLASVVTGILRSE